MNSFIGRKGKKFPLSVRSNTLPHSEMGIIDIQNELIIQSEGARYPSG